MPDQPEASKKTFQLEEATIAERGARKELASSESAYAKAQAERDRLAVKARG